jgi:hypothetical protein
MKQWILAAVLAPSLAIAQANPPPQPGPDVPANIFRIGLFAAVGNAAFVCGYRAIEWSNKVEDYMFEAAMLEIIPEGTNHATQNVRNETVDYIVGMGLYGSGFNAGQCANLAATDGLQMADEIELNGWTPGFPAVP